MTIFGVTEATFEIPSPQIEIKILGTQSVGKWIRVFAQILGKDGQSVIDKSSIYITTRYNSLLFRNPTGELLPLSQLYFRTQTVRYRSLIELEDSLIDQLKYQMVGDNTDASSQLTYDQVLNFAISGGSIQPYEIKNATSESEVSVSWKPKKVIAVWDEDDAHGTNYFYDGDNNPGLVNGKNLTLKRELAWPISTVWIDYFVGGIISFDFKPTFLTEKPEIIFLYVNSLTGYRDFITLDVKGGGDGSDDVSGKSIEASRTSLLTGETSDIIVRYKDSDGKFLNNPKCKFVLEDESIGDIVPNVTQSDSQGNSESTIGGQEVIDNIEAVEYKSIEEHGDIFKIVVSHAIDSLTAITYIDYQGALTTIGSIQEIVGDTIYLQRDSAPTLDNDYFHSHTFLLGNPVKVEYTRISEEEVTVGYDEETGYMTFSTAEAIDEIRTIYYEKEYGTLLWRDSKSYFIGSTVYLCNIDNPYVRGKRIYVGTKAGIWYTTRGIKATFTATTAEEKTAIIFAVPILSDGSEDYQNTQRIDIAVNKGKIMAITLESTKLEYENGEDIEISPRVTASDSDIIRYLTVNYTSESIGAYTMVPSSASGTQVIMSTGVAIFNIPSGVGYINCTAYIKQGNDTLYSNTLRLLIYPIAGESGAALMQVLDRARRTGLDSASVTMIKTGGSGGSISWNLSCNPNGYCAIRGLIPDTYSLLVSHSGYTDSDADDYDDNDEIEII